ncbi:LysM peptidoglycan-binding domain-containing protein [Streptomyces sp. FXJ1.172]|uniref:LysM peptidoglycan-binding domain-containing protein n=1 Tax=Streptomyces sp. FXJ1.172 TaxID=710705 RepID=UPI0007CF629B|nr:LysM peptidoglycan-binding domain-containing protein [Streptomyces sp. FXJ1.172]WEO93415.1 LysM peptidoglycan-binding domain-containing protein [Streptomyces sp. FXJ1.172]
MPLHARKRPSRARRLIAGGAVTVGTFALVSTAALGTAQAAPAASAATTTYTVQPGDHLASIARAQHVPGGWSAIATANHIASPYALQPGQVLTLPAGSTPATKPATATKAASTSTTTTAGSQGYTNNLDGWIKHSLAIMAQNGIPGSYNGIYRNVMRESSGNPNAINLWDSNAAAGHPSIGLLQVIQSTFAAYHVPGTSSSIYDPVANITAACNYAYHRYGSIDNVNGPY